MLDTKDKALKACGIKNASDTTAAEECCFWTRFAGDMKLVQDDEINIDALSQLLSPPGDESNGEQLGQCEEIGRSSFTYSELYDLVTFSSKRAAIR